MVHSPNNHSFIDLSGLPAAGMYYVAFSGGIDSTSLIHALSEVELLKHKLTAIHVNHNIDPNSSLWAEHCADFCQQLNIPIIIESVELPDHSENSCRIARHQVFQKHLTGNDCLITGHHQMDQIETMLFRLFRGTGLHGLTAMKTLSQHHSYPIFRPMLSAEIEQINDYVKQKRLSYILDPSNLNDKYSRNFIRNQLIPLLQTQNSNVLQNIALSRNNLFSSNLLLNTLIGQQNPLDITNFKTPELLMSALNHWLNALNKPSPSHHQLRQFSIDCQTAALDTSPRLSTVCGDLIRWKHKIYFLKPDILDKSMSSISVQLKANEPFELPANNGSIELKSDKNFELNCQIQYQITGQSIKLRNQKHSQKLKKLFQLHQIPPWERQVSPYMFIEDKLMAVGSKFIANDFIELLEPYNAEYQWLSPRFLL